MPPVPFWHTAAPENGSHGLPCLQSTAIQERCVNVTGGVRLAADNKLRPPAVKGGGVFSLNSMDICLDHRLQAEVAYALTSARMTLADAAEHLSDLLDGEAGPNPPRLQDAPSAPSDDEGGGVVPPAALRPSVV